jgi:hypothetical protein
MWTRTEEQIEKLRGLQKVLVLGDAVAAAVSMLGVWFA